MVFWFPYHFNFSSAIDPFIITVLHTWGSWAEICWSVENHLFWKTFCARCWPANRDLATPSQVHVLWPNSHIIQNVAIQCSVFISDCPYIQVLIMLNWINDIVLSSLDMSFFNHLFLFYVYVWVPDDHQGQKGVANSSSWCSLSPTSPVENAFPSSFSKST